MFDVLVDDVLSQWTISYGRICLGDRSNSVGGPRYQLEYDRCSVPENNVDDRSACLVGPALRVCLLTASSATAGGCAFLAVRRGFSEGVQDGGRGGAGSKG